MSAAASLNTSSARTAPSGSGSSGSASPDKVNPATEDTPIRSTSATSIDTWIPADGLSSVERFEAAFAHKYEDQSLDELDNDLVGEYYEGLDRIAAAAPESAEAVGLPTRHVHSGAGLGVDAYLNPSGDLSAENMMTQRYVGDCYYVAGITAVAAGDPQLLRDAITPGQDEGTGERFYDVALYAPEGTTVDFGAQGGFTFESLGADGQVGTFYAGARTTVRVTQSEIDAWHASQGRAQDGDRTVSLLEVSMEKLIGHDELNNGGAFNEAAYALTGRNGTSFESHGAHGALQTIGDNPRLSAFEDAQWRDNARRVLDDGGFIGVSINGRSPGFEANWDPDAPSGGHQYAVLEVTDRGMILANPWGFVEPGADFDPHNFDPAKNGDGVFFVPWEDAQSTFHSVSVVGGPSDATPPARISGDVAKAAVLDRAVAEYEAEGRPGNHSDEAVRNHFSGQLKPEQLARLYMVLQGNPDADLFHF